MSQTKTTAPPATEEGSGLGVRHALVILSLLWAVALMPIVSMLSGNSQSLIAIHFHTTQIAWFTLSTALVGTFATPFVMKAAAMYGKKRVMVVIAVFGLAGDLLAALATNYETLLIGRSVAGIYGPAAPLAYSMARDVFPRRLVGPASGFLGGSVGLVGLGGPFLSGWVIDNHGFRGALWFMVISTVVCLALVLAFVPESPVRQERTRMDWLGGLLLGGGLTAIVYGIGEGTAWGWTSAKLLSYLGLGLLALIVFLVVESRVAHPLLPLSILARRPVWTVLLATAVASGAILASGLLTQLLALMPKIPHVSGGLGWSATKNALVLAPMSLTTILMATAAGALARKIDTRVLLGLGSVLTAVGFGLGSQIHETAAQFAIWGLIVGPGVGLVMAITPIMIIGTVAPEEQALANGTQFLIQGVAQGVFVQLLFVVMARNGTVVQGTQFYLDSGFTNGLWLISGLCAAGALLVPLTPRVKRIDDTLVGQAVA
ncbi:MFS transporter [Streptomyces cylindrosporus]|uniref:MFS transporter n=1 Tax=Streptomyces cylindrosporus TaxID=2927583 RepID=A0ABS9Y8L7_9ACTN|nr:MFS transporter [Streptomyces cylindrosporus]MCI3272266.1 MFS transporter [Streptomyces cylindrosporus]